MRTEEGVAHPGVERPYFGPEHGVPAYQPASADPGPAARPLICCTCAPTWRLTTSSHPSSTLRRVWWWQEVGSGQAAALPALVALQPCRAIAARSRRAAAAFLRCCRAAVASVGLAATCAGSRPCPPTPAVPDAASRTAWFAAINSVSAFFILGLQLLATGGDGLQLHPAASSCIQLHPGCCSSSGGTSRLVESMAASPHLPAISVPRLCTPQDACCDGLVFRSLSPCCRPARACSWRASRCGPPQPQVRPRACPACPG